MATIAPRLRLPQETEGRRTGPQRAQAWNGRWWSPIPKVAHLVVGIAAAGLAKPTLPLDQTRADAAVPCWRS